MPCDCDAFACNVTSVYSRFACRAHQASPITFLPVRRNLGVSIPPARLLFVRLSAKLVLYVKLRLIFAPSQKPMWIKGTGTTPQLAQMTSIILLWAGSTTAAEPARINFSRDILPILSDNCFFCHGPDTNNRKADLRLDTKDGALRTKSPVIVPGKSGESELILRVTSDDKEELMPPPKSNRVLTLPQIEVLQR